MHSGSLRELRDRLFGLHLPLHGAVRGSSVDQPAPIEASIGVLTKPFTQTTGIDALAFAGNGFDGGQQLRIALHRTTIVIDILALR